MSFAETHERAANHPIVVFKHQIEQRAVQLKAALPSHIPVERFMRVVMTAVANNPGLLTKVDRNSLVIAVTRAAQDGLLPDGREGAIVEFGGKAQWMTMIAGLRKKARNSGEIATWETQVVYANDAFEFQLGDDPFIRHTPALGERGKPIGAYSIATLKTGEKSREWMSIAEIEKVRSASRAKGAGPWTQWWEEMARKSVARRHSKVLPMSTDLEELFHRDDDEGEHHHAEQPAPRVVTGLASKLEALGADAETGEILEHETQQHSAADSDKPAADEAGAVANSPQAAAAPAEDDPNYAALLGKLEADMASATTVEALDEIGTAARDAWAGAAPKAIFQRVSKIYSSHRNRITGRGNQESAR